MNIGKRKGFIKRRTLLVFAIIFMIVPPMIALASKSNSKTETKTNEEYLKNIQTIINYTPDRGDFPQGEQRNYAEIDAKLYIYHKESGNNPYSINKRSGACGLGQALPCSKMSCNLGDYECQDKWFTNYMKQRYGTWQNAKRVWDIQKWW